MRAVEIIRKKRDGGTLDVEEIETFVRAATVGEWKDYQVSALLMAICCRGMTEEETAYLTASMVRSGERLDLSDLPGPKIDKHSTGGVGDKTSLILAPLAAACGVVVPMMSGRGLGHTGGTLDKLESIPGFRVNLSLDEFRKTLRKVGCAMIGQTKEIAPADRVLYHLRDVTGTVENIPLITASIMSKKIAEGIEGLVLDVKCGAGAFMKTTREAKELADSLVRNGEANGVRTEALLTSMNDPLGHAIGTALEVEESIKVLKNVSHGPLVDLSVHLAARMVRLAGLARSLAEAERKVRDALTSGRGLRKLRQIIRQQGGDPKVISRTDLLPFARKRAHVLAHRPGYVTSIHAEKIGRATMLLGAGRSHVKDRIDPAAGAVILAHRGEKVREGDMILELHYNRNRHLEQAMDLAREAYEIGDAPPPPSPLILATPEGRDHVHG